MDYGTRMCKIRKRIYIAGPITGVANKNSEAFNRAAEKLKELGYEAISPIELDKYDNGLLNYEDYLSRDLGYLVSCTAICLLPGWEHSYGTRIELAVAQALRFPIFRFEGEDLLEETGIDVHVVCDVLVPSTFWN